MTRIKRDYADFLHKWEVEVLDDKRQPLTLLSQRYLCGLNGRSRIHCIVRDGRSGKDYHLPKQKIRALFDHRQQCSHVLIFVYPRRGRRRNKWIMASVHDSRTFLLPETAFVDEDEDERTIHRRKK